MKTCNFKNCDREHSSHGYCSAHAMQLHQGRELKPIKQRAARQKDSDSDTKQCGKCKLFKSVDEFNRHKSGKYKGFCYSYCRECSKIQSQEGYLKHKKRYDTRNMEKRIAQRDNLRKLIWEYFETHPCVDCGNNDPMVLQFDHTDREDKEHTISRIVNNGYSTKTVFKEIAKCQVRCANCHIKRTAKQMGWWSVRDDGILE